MRLLNTTSFKLKEFFGDNIPGYAILSHRWEDEEVTLQDLQHGRGPQMAGYSKIQGFCKQAAAAGWEWAWADSCCIDKTSSSELSETINSMFKWYENAKVCYVYLSDVTALFRYTALKRSKWFTRGWTLQELLAPPRAIFFSREWIDIGTKNSLRNELSSITGIGLHDLHDFKSACIARKMSWASKRETTRPEDKAYCLMGLFGINMPTLYGEGNRAFYRLQLEILSSSDDESIFAWSTGTPPIPDDLVWLRDKGAERLGSRPKGGLLAISPLDFVDCSDVKLAPIPGVPYMERSPYAMTNKGLRMEHLLRPFLVGGVTDHQFLSLLHCKSEEKAGNLAIPVFQGWGSQPAERIIDKVYHVGSTKEIQKRILYIKQVDTGKRTMRPSSSNASLILRWKNDFSTVLSQTFTPVQVLTNWVDPTLTIPVERPDGSWGIPFSGKTPTSDSRAIIAFRSINLEVAFAVSLSWSKSLGATILGFESQQPPPLWDKLPEDLFTDRTSKVLENGIAVFVAIIPGWDNGVEISLIEISMFERC